MTGPTINQRSTEAVAPSILPPLPEWAKRDDLGGLVPSQIRAAMIEHARAAWHMGLDYGLVHVPAETATGLPELRDLLARAADSGQAINLSPAAAGALHHAMTTGEPLSALPPLTAARVPPLQDGTPP